MRIISTLVFVLIVTTSLVAQSNGANIFTNNAFQGGVGLGTIVAVVISWSRNKSVLWAILHGIFGWLYVIYYALTK